MQEKNTTEKQVGLLSLINRITWTLAICFRYRGEALRNQLSDNSEKIVNAWLAFGSSAAVLVLAEFILLSIAGFNVLDPWHPNLAFSKEAYLELMNEAQDILSNVHNLNFNVDKRTLVVTWALICSCSLILMAIAKLSYWLKNKRKRACTKTDLLAAGYEATSYFIVSSIYILAISIMLVIIGPYIRNVNFYNVGEYLVVIVLLGSNLVGPIIVYCSTKNELEIFSIKLMGIPLGFLPILSILIVHQMNVALRKPVIEARVTDVCAVDDEKGCILALKLHNLDELEISHITAIGRRMDKSGNPKEQLNLEFKIRPLSGNPRPITLVGEKEEYAMARPISKTCELNSSLLKNNGPLTINFRTFQITGLSSRFSEKERETKWIDGNFIGVTTPLGASLQTECTDKG
jgi:hypothetical protein